MMHAPAVALAHIVLIPVGRLRVVSLESSSESIPALQTRVQQNAVPRAIRFGLKLSTCVSRSVAEPRQRSLNKCRRGALVESWDATLLVQRAARRPAYFECRLKLVTVQVLFYPSATAATHRRASSVEVPWRYW